MAFPLQFIERLKMYSLFIIFLNYCFCKLYTVLCTNCIDSDNVDSVFIGIHILKYVMSSILLHVLLSISFKTEPIALSQNFTAGPGMAN